MAAHDDITKRDRHHAITLICIAAVVFTALFLLSGCRTTHGIAQDEFPPGVPCQEARQDAIKHYREVWHEEPRVPPVSVHVTAQPPQGYGAITRASGKGYAIDIWRDQYPFYGSLVHEFGHSLKGASGKGMGEGGL